MVDRAGAVDNNHPSGRGLRGPLFPIEVRLEVDMQDVRYDRLCRTANSESYLISEGEDPLGRVELHFTSSTVYGLLVLEKEFQQEEIGALIQAIDDDLVWTSDLPRDDFVVTVYQGKELGVYSDPEWDEEEVDDSENQDQSS